MTWFNDMNPNGTAQERGGDMIGGALEGVKNYLAPIQARKEERDYQDKNAAEGRARAEAELNRPVEQPVNDLLNAMQAKLAQPGVAPGTGNILSTLWKMVQSGQITEQQAQERMDDIIAGAGATTPPPMAGGPPMPPMGTPVQEPGGAVAAPQMHAPIAPAPPQAPQPMPVPQSPPPMNAPAPMPAQPAQASAPALTPPPANPTKPYQWTQRGVKQLNDAGGFPKNKDMSEMQVALELIKTQQRNNQVATTVAGKNGVEANKLTFKEKELAAKVKNWEANRTNAWAIANARIKAMESISSGKGEAKRDVDLLKEAAAELRKRIDANTELRKSLGALDSNKGNPVHQQLAKDDELIKQATDRVRQMRQLVEARGGVVDLGQIDGPEFHTETSSTPVNKPAPTVDAFLQNIRGN